MLWFAEVKFMDYEDYSRANACCSIEKNVAALRFNMAQRVIETVEDGKLLKTVVCPAIFFIIRGLPAALSTVACQLEN